MFASAPTRSSGSHEDWKVNNTIPLLDTIYFPPDPLSLSCSLRAPATFSNFHPSDTCDRHPHASLDTSLKQADINDLPDLFTDREASVDMPDPQSSSEDSSREGDSLQFPPLSFLILILYTLKKYSKLMPLQRTCLHCSPPPQMSHTRSFMQRTHHLQRKKTITYTLSWPHCVPTSTYKLCTACINFHKWLSG